MRYVHRTSSYYMQAAISLSRVLLANCYLTSTFAALSIQDDLALRDPKNRRLYLDAWATGRDWRNRPAHVFRVDGLVSFRQGAFVRRAG